ncbi:MAG: Na+/H+ antiporter NhaC family protein [Cyanobacteria bacterium P01_A01_bin.135]
MDIALAIALSFTLLLLGAAQGVYMAYPLLGALVAFGLVARRRGTPWRVLMQLAWGGVRKSFGVIGILLLIGVLVALWMAAGTVPALVYWGLAWVQPRTFLLWAFLLPGVVSVLIGTSFGAVSTIGLALMTMASSSALNSHLVAGAIIGGAYVGDRCSPVSSSANLVATVTGTSLQTNLRAMVRTGLLPVLLTALIYVGLSMTMPPLTIDRQLQADIALTFSRHWSVLLPAVLVLGLSVVRVPVLYTLGFSIAAAAAIARVVQGVPLNTLLQFAVGGFRLPEAAPVADLFQAGGGLAMARVCGVVVVSTALAGILTQTLSKVEAMLRSPAKLQPVPDRSPIGTWYSHVSGPTPQTDSTDPRQNDSQQNGPQRRRSRQFFSTGLVGIATALFGCTQTIAILLTQQLVARNYAGDGSPNAAETLALDLENTVVVVSPLIPWNIAGLVPATVLMTDAGFIPFAVYLYLQPLVVLAQLRLKR